MFLNFNAAVTYIDSSAVQALKDLYQEYKSRGIQVEYRTLWLHVVQEPYFRKIVWIIGFVLQIAISNLNHEVLLTLSKSGVVDLIGKEWYFVRAHDAVQVCLQHVQSLKETANAPYPLPDDKLSFLQRLLKSRGEDLSIAELESGAQRPPDFKNTDPKLEPLLSRKTWICILASPSNIKWCQFLARHVNVFCPAAAIKIWLFLVVSLP